MTKSDEIGSEWLQLYRDMRARPDLDRRKIAAPFLSVPPVDRRRPIVLYVGKATSADCWDNRGHRFSLHERRKRMRKWLNSMQVDRHSAFWDFAKELSMRIDAKGRQLKRRPLENIVWTNIYKIGVKSLLPPLRRYAQPQQNLAIKTLRWEIKSYRPALIVCVTGKYADEVILDAVGRAHWRKQKGMRWRKAHGFVPPILLIGHPQYKKRELLEVWLKKACQLLPA